MLNFYEAFRIYSLLLLRAVQAFAHNGVLIQPELLFYKSSSSSKAKLAIMFENGFLGR